MIRLIVIAAAIIACSSAFYFYVLYQNLACRIQHKFHCGSLSELCPKLVQVETIPSAVFSGRYFTLYYQCARSISRKSLPSDESVDDLLTKLVRRNVTVFTHFPQAFVYRIASTTVEERMSFSASHIASLGFQEGELVCGVYRVKFRDKNKVEFQMQMKNMDFLDGRLAISFWERDDKVVFCSETIMWRLCKESRAMPLERPLFRWMHEIAAWWLMDSGVNYLADLES